jgi:hypothetical protein
MKHMILRELYTTLVILVNNCGFGSTLKKYESSFLSSTASLLAPLATMYSAFAVLWAMEPYFPLDQEIIAEPKLKQYLKVLFQYTVLPIQSESV